MPFSRELSWPRDQTSIFYVSCIGRWVLCHLHHLGYVGIISNVCTAQFGSVAQSWLTLCDPIDCSLPGFPVHHQLPELAQTQVHQVSDAIQPSHPLSSPSLPAFNLSQHQGLFLRVGSSHHGAKVLELQPQQQSFQWTVRTDFLQDWLIWSPCSPRDSQESSPTSQFKSISSSVLSFLYVSTFTSIHDYWKTIALTRWNFVGKIMSLLFNMLSRLVIAFLPRIKYLLISWLQSPSAVILEPKKMKFVEIGKDILQGRRMEGFMLNSWT